MRSGRARTAPSGGAADRAAAGRRHDVECLRVVGMAAVFAVHVALVFVPWMPWHLQSQARSPWAGQIALAIAPWVMPLFMLLAGESAWYALRRRDDRAFVAERVRHVLVPLVVGIPVLVAPQVYLERRLAGDVDGGLLAFYGRFADGVYPQGNFAWHHLWFLGYLFVFSLAALPLFRALDGGRGRRLVARAAGIASRPGGLLLLAVPVVAARGALSEAMAAWLDTPADWHNRTLLPLAFVCGYVFASDARFVRAAVRQRRSLTAVALAATAAFAAYASLGDPVARLPRPGTAASALFWSAYALAGWSWVLALAGLARRHVVRGGGALRAASDAVYGFYLVHQPVLVAVAFVVVSRALPLPAQAAIVGVAGLAISILLTATIGTRVGRTLLGATSSRGAVTAAARGASARRARGGDDHATHAFHRPRRASVAEEVH